MQVVMHLPMCSVVVMMLAGCLVEPPIQPNITVSPDLESKTVLKRERFMLQYLSAIPALVHTTLPDGTPRMLPVRHPTLGFGGDRSVIVSNEVYAPSTMHGVAGYAYDADRLYIVGFFQTSAVILPNDAILGRGSTRFDLYVFDLQTAKPLSTTHAVKTIEHAHPSFHPQGMHGMTFELKLIKDGVRVMGRDFKFE